mmetsp:Transcript_10186/g.16808  ORF Transcript_10186/g.16808 Transcript_10186/m.16808 type:complete len:81 (-) Transcript_10186:864-1106(-)
MDLMRIEENIFWTVENEVWRKADEKRKAEVTINPSKMKKTVAMWNVEEMTNPSATSHFCFWIAVVVDEEEAATTVPVTKS